MKVSVCLLLDGGYWATRYCFQKIGFAKKEKVWTKSEERGQIANYIEGLEVQLLVADTNCNDSRMKDYFEPIADCYLECDGDSEAVAYNKLFRLAEGEFICILNNKMIHPTGWLTELVYYAEIVKSSGIVCITEKLEGKTYSTVLDKELDEFIGVFTCGKDSIDGTCLFKKEYLNYIGAFQEDPPLYGSELNQYAIRSTCMGLSNFFVPDCFLIRAERNSEYSQELRIKGLENLDLSLEEMANRKSWYIKLN
jgi:hypothetical protein